MLTENEAGRVWQRMFEAEVRSLYFADLAARHSRRKRIMTGVIFFLSSGAAATILAALPKQIPIVLSLIVAILTAYSIAVNLDTRIKTFLKLHYEWNRLESEYERLWNHWRDADAEGILADLVKRGRDASEIAAEFTFDEERIGKWTRFVQSRFPQVTA